MTEPLVITAVAITLGVVLLVVAYIVYEVKQLRSQLRLQESATAKLERKYITLDQNKNVVWWGHDYDVYAVERFYGDCPWLTRDWYSEGPVYTSKKEAVAEAKKLSGQNTIRVVGKKLS